ncbi:MAG: hypothetical protein DLM60_16675 [Pseudonocardiales bacterium]|nr:MAG: hypothetical protein DLM60_16675 [Pseudonocardiales bacterium]
MDRGHFCRIFSDRAVVVTRLPKGSLRTLAERANETAGRGDASLQTRVEYSALFDLLVRELGADPAATVLTLADEHGQPTQTGKAVETFRAAAVGKDEFFDQALRAVGYGPRRRPTHPPTTQ